MEIWETISGFKNYQVSNYGNVKSLKFNKERFLNKSINKQGYYCVCLSMDNKKYKTNVHQLVAMSFLNHNRCGYIFVINHKDFNRLNNKVDNLEVITQRENTNLKHKKSTSKYTGVSFYRPTKKWISQIHINGKQKYLGLFNTEIEAHNRYKEYLFSLTIFV
jgi:hypothetical protein